MGRNNKALISVLPLIASTLADKYGVKVLFGHYPTAMTDGDTIYLPNLPLEGEEVGILANGFIDHESAHIRETTFDVMRKAKTTVEKHLLNILEDLRIEQAMVQTFPGTKRNLATLAEHMVKTGGFALPEDDHPINTLLSTTLNVGRCDVLGQDALADLATASEQHFLKVFGKGAFVRLRALLMEANSLDSTAQALDLARKIIAMLKEEEEKDDDTSDSSQDPSNPSTDDSAGDDQQGDSSDSDTGDDGTGGGNDDAADDSGNSDNQDGQGQDSQGSDGDDTDPSNADGNASGDKGHGSPMEQVSSATDQDVTVKSDLGDAIADELNDACDKSSGDRLSGHQMTLDDFIGDGEPVNPSDVKRETMRMRSRLSAQLQTLLRKKQYTAREGRRFDSRNLSRMATGDNRVFLKREEAKGLDTAVYVLLDRSGSMNQRMGLAMQSAMATMLALAGTSGLASACTEFPSITRLTSFSESIHTTKHRYVPRTTGCTPLAEALLFAAQDLGTRRETRKLVITITDGDPDDPDLARKITQRMSAAGVEMLGLGIGADYLRHIFPESECIEDVSELSGAIFRLLERKLVA